MRAIPVVVIALIAGSIPLFCSNSGDTARFVLPEPADAPVRYASVDSLEDAAMGKDVPYVPTRQETVDEMLRMANIDSNDVVYDLGCGDGRIVVSAARDYGARGVGIDIDPQRIKEANENAERAGVTDKVRFIRGDLFEADISEATALLMYLLPSVNLKLRPTILSDLRPGTPVVSHDFSMAEWKPDDERTVGGDRLYLWYVPAKVEGTWNWQAPDGSARRVNLAQKFQEISGTTTGDGQIVDAKLRGEAIEFAIADASGNVLERYRGTVNGNRISGTIERGNGARVPWSAVHE